MSTLAYVVTRVVGTYVATALDGHAERDLGDHLTADRAALAVLRDVVPGRVDGDGGRALAARFVRDFLTGVEGRRGGHATVRVGAIRDWLATGEATCTATGEAADTCDHVQIDEAAEER